MQQNEAAREFSITEKLRRDENEQLKQEMALLRQHNEALSKRLDAVRKESATNIFPWYRATNAVDEQNNVYAQELQHMINDNGIYIVCTVLFWQVENLHRTIDEKDMQLSKLQYQLVLEKRKTRDLTHEIMDKEQVMNESSVKIPLLENIISQQNLSLIHISEPTRPY